MRLLRRSRSSTRTRTDRAGRPRFRRAPAGLAASTLALAAAGVLLGGSLAAAAQAPMPAASPTPSHSVSPTPTPTPRPDCQVLYTVPSSPAGGFQAQITITNTGPAISAWQLNYWYPTNNATLTAGTNANWSQAGYLILASNLSSNGSLGTGKSVTISAAFTVNGAPEIPRAFELNGVTCGNAGGTISGTVTNESGAALSGLNVRVCVVDGAACSAAATSQSGFYIVTGLADGDYQTDTADPPLLSGHAGPITIAGADAQTADMVLLTNAALPPGVAIPGAQAGPDGPPLIHWGQPNPFSVIANCTNGYGNFQVIQNGALIAQGPMFNNPPGSFRYTGTLPPFAPHNHGYAQVIVTIYCPNGTIDQIPFLIYIDPSGNVLSPGGQPIDGATVTLLTAASASGPFTPVPNGSDLMSPANTTNPMTTTANGHFGWDTQPGFYEVQASKPGCHTPTSPQAAVASTPVLQVPPAVTGLVLTLDCGASPAPAITSADQATFTAGTGGTFTVTATGAPTPALSETGSLPSGVTFTPNSDGTAIVAVSPTAAAGVITFTLDAGNKVGNDATQFFTLTVNPNSGPVITSAPSANFTAGTGGTFTVTSTGTPTATLSESGTLPTGVTFTPNSNGTATIAVGAAAAAGVSTLTITASNGSGVSATQSLSLNIVAPAPAITTPAAAIFTLTPGTGGTYAIAATGSPTPTLSESGALPAGVTFTPNGNGTATLAVGSTAPPGTTTLTLTASNGVSPSATQSFSLTINPTPPSPAITSASSANFTAGTGGAFTITSTGNPTPTLTWTGTPPAGVTFTPHGDGTATLTVSAKAPAGTSTLTLTATNGVAPASSQPFTLNIN